MITQLLAIFGGVGVTPISVEKWLIQSRPNASIFVSVWVLFGHVTMVTSRLLI